MFVNHFLQISDIVACLLFANLCGKGARGIKTNDASEAAHNNIEFLSRGPASFLPMAN
jgi:hypothetical protein